MDFNPIVELLNEIIEDRSVPRNIRDSVDEVKKTILEEDTELEVKVNTAVSILDELCNDINIPVYTRTQIWNVVSMLESIEK